MLKIPVDPSPPTPKPAASRALVAWLLLGPLLVLLLLIWFFVW